MVRKWFIPSVLIFLLVSTGLRAQEPVFRHLGYENGLPSNTVHTVYQDQTGLMWFGTDKGLCYYDGYKFITHSISTDSLHFNVTAIYQQSGDIRRLWIGSNKGLFSYDILKDVLLKKKLGKWGEIKVNNICEGEDGILWVAADKGVCRFNTLNGEKISYYKLPLNPAQKRINASCIFRDSKGRIWAAAGMGIFKYNKRQDTFFHVITLSKKIGPPEKRISQICEDKNGALWIASYGEGLFRYEPSSGKIENYRGPNKVSLQARINYQRALIIDKMGTIWVGTYGNGLLRFNKKSGKFDFYIKSSDNPYSISDNDVTSLYEDSQGLIWIGTLHNGVSRFDRSIPQINNFKLPGGVGVTAFCKDHNNRIWMGTEKGSLAYYDLRTERLIVFNIRLFPFKSRITAITEDISQKFLWVATLGHGLCRFDLRSHEFRCIKAMPRPAHSKQRRQNIFAMLKDKKNGLWLGLNHMPLLRYDLNSGKFYQYQIQKLTTCFLKDNKGRLWAGHKNEVSLFDDKKNVFKDIKLPAVAGGQTVFRIKQSSDGTIWLGTSKGLLSVEDYHSSQVNFKQYPDFNGYQIKEIIEDRQHTLWLATQDGILRFDPVRSSIRKFGYEEGIKDLDFNGGAGIRVGNRIFMGNSSGFLTFNAMKNSTIQAPDIIITNFQYINTSQLVLPEAKPRMFVSLPDTIFMEWAHYTFFIDFSLNDYLLPNRNRYAYKLEGMDNDWHNLGSQHTLNFINLPPKAYTLHIRGAGSAGLWNEKGVSLTFIIAAPFWQEWWFRISAGLFLIAAIWLIFLVRTFSIRRRNRQLQELNKKLNTQIVYREQVEKMLRESENKYRTLVEGIGESIYVINKAGVFSFLNKTAAERIGGTPDDFIGRALRQIFDKKAAESYLTEVDEVIRKRKAKLINTSIKLNGELRHFRVSLQPLKNINGEIDQVLSIAIETTEQVTLEEQLRQAQKMEAIGKLAGGVAHDFNNLLSIIRGYTYLLLQESDLDDSFVESLTEIEKAGKRAQSLTGQLLAFSRKQILEPKVMDLNHHIREMEKMLRRLLGEQIQLTTDLMDNLPPIFADSGQIEQILMNLSVNARDAMPDGGKLHIKTEIVRPQQYPSIIPSEKNHGEFIVLSVRDTGVGMDVEVQQKIFDPFFTTKAQGKGTGLGLSTVFGIVKQTDGYIWVDSAPGKGSEFKIYFPAVKDSIPQKKKDDETKPDLRGTEHVLLVEDEEGLQTMISKMLRLYGYKVTTAANGTEGINKYAASPEEYHIILTDVVMPDMSGVEMITRLSERFGEIPVLYMSGYTDDEVIRHGIVERGISFIQKPFTPQKVTQKMRRILDSKDSA